MVIADECGFMAWSGWPCRAKLAGYLSHLIEVIGTLFQRPRTDIAGANVIGTIGRQ